VMSRRWRQWQWNSGYCVLQRSQTRSSHSCWTETPWCHQGQM